MAPAVTASGVAVDDPGVIARSNGPDPPTPRPLSNWSMAAGALLVLAVAAVVSLAASRAHDRALEPLLIALALLPHLPLDVGPAPAIPAAGGDDGRGEQATLYPLGDGASGHAKPTSDLTRGQQRLVIGHVFEP